MIYELRRYECLPGKLPAINKMMDKLAMPRFKQHDMKVVGCWNPAVGDAESTLIYMLAWNDMNEWKTKWDAFKNDEWQRMRVEYGAKEGGPFVSKSINSFLLPTNYSPLK
jgi:hypothetical protein